MNIAILLLYSLFRVAVQGRSPPSFHFRVMFFPGMIAGVLWSIGACRWNTRSSFPVFPVSALRLLPPLSHIVTPTPSHSFSLSLLRQLSQHLRCSLPRLSNRISLCAGSSRGQWTLGHFLLQRAQGTSSSHVVFVSVCGDGWIGVAVTDACVTTKKLKKLKNHAVHKTTMLTNGRNTRSS